MSYCLNPSCPRPQNPDGAKFCQNCGKRLLLGDRYRAFSSLGSGSASQTFLGLDTHQLINPRCIIKAFATGERADAFRQEVVQLAALSEHPQIPELLAYFEREQRQYLVQEFVGGRSLLQQLNEEGPLEEAQIVQMLGELLPLLQFLHEHQIIHRGIKPTSLIRRASNRLHSDGLQSDGLLVLVDFGAVKRVTKSGLAKTGTVIGSAEYTAPEQLMGKAVFASDLYSVGVTCIHLLTGLRPFDLFHSASGTWIWQSVAGPVSEPLSHILDRLLQDSVRLRYESAAEVLQALKPLGLVTPAMPLSIPSPKPDLAQPDFSEWHCVLTLTASAAVGALAIAPTGNLMASGGSEPVIQLWDLSPDLSPETAISELEGHQQAIASLAISPDGQTLASGSWDRTVKLWDLATGKLLHTLTGHSQVVMAVAIYTETSGRQTVISGSRDRTLRLWDLETGDLMQTFASGSAVESLALSGDVPLLASGAVDGTVKIWHLGTRELLRTLSGHAAAVNAVALSGSSTLISGSSDTMLKRRHVNTGGIQNSWSGHLLPIGAIALHPQRQLLASGSHDTTLKLWDPHQGKLLQTLTDHNSAIETIAFGPRGDLVSGSRDRTLKIWRCA